MVSATGWRLVVEEVLQLGEAVTQLAPAVLPGLLLAGVGSALAAYRLVRFEIQTPQTQPEIGFHKDCQRRCRGCCWPTLVAVWLPTTWSVCRWADL